MPSLVPSRFLTDPTLRQAALTAGLAYLLNPAPWAESVFPRLLIPGNFEQTAANTIAHPGLLNALILSYLVMAIGDVVIAWALFYLVAPVSRALAALMSLFQLIYATVAVAATLNLITVARLIAAPTYLAALGPAPLHVQIDLLLHSFRYSFSFSLILFGIHLVLLGVLVLRSTYIPRLVGAALVIAGAGYIADGAGTYALPNTDLGWLFYTFPFELVFVPWLWIRGWRLPSRTSVSPETTAGVLP